jgi:hypothetical protein
MKLLKLFAYTFSVFSVIFSFSTVIELHKFTNLFVFILTSIFLLFFAVYVEIAKVRELSKYFLKRKASKPLIIVTFSLSFILSGVGIFFWTNETQQKEKEVNETTNISLISIETKYNRLTDSINSVAVDYSEVEKELSYWKTRSAATISEREQIRQNVTDLTDKKMELYKVSEERKQSQIQALNKQKQAEINLVSTRYEAKGKENGRNNFLTAIFLIMVVVTEILIVGIQKQISSHFDSFQLSAVRMVKEYSLRGIDFNDPSAINKIKYHPHIIKHFKGDNDSEAFKLVKDTYNLLFEISIVGEDGKLAKDASKQLSNYYSKINAI